MKRMLIKVVLVLLVVYISGELSLKYSNYVASTFKYNLPIVILFRSIPGLLCGLILGYESVLRYAKNKSHKFDFRYLLLSILLILLVLSPYLSYAYPFSVSSSVVRILNNMSSYTFSLIASLMAGYCFTQSFSIKK